MAGAQLRSMKRALSMRLQRVESSELVEFPETEEGHLGKVACFPLTRPLSGDCMLCTTFPVQLMGVCCADPVVLLPVPHAGALPLPPAADPKYVIHLVNGTHSEIWTVVWTALRRSWRMSWRTCMLHWTASCLF